MKILNVKGVKEIDKSTQKSIKGGHDIDIWCLKKCLSSGYPANVCHELCEW